MSLSTHPPGRIVVIRSGAVGDFILTTPVLRSLRLSFPEAHLTVIGHPGRTILADHLVDARYDIDDPAWSRLFVPDAHLEGGPHDLLAESDLIVNYLPDPDGVLTHNLKAGCKGRVITHGPHPPPDGTVHIVDHLLSALDPLGIETHRSPSVAAADLDQFPGPFAVLHPGSGGSHKMWPVSRFSELARRLSADRKVVFTWGPADGDLVGPLRSELPDALFVNDLSLPELAGLYQAADLYVGNDSGPTHLAAAAGTPTVAIFGPTDPATWGPIGERVEIVRAAPGSDVDAVSVDEVQEAVNRLI